MAKKWETCWQRACKDTEHFRKSGWSFWAWEVVGAAVFGVVGALVGYWLTPSSSNPFWQFAYPTIGGGIGVVIGFVITFSLILGWNLFRAPYKQRDEARDLLTAKPKPVTLPNRHELISAIHRLKETAREAIWRNDILKTKREIGDASESEKAFVDYSTAYKAYDDAEKQLECETSVAGEVFRKPITSFQNTVKLYVLSRETPNAPEYTEMLTKLRDAVNEVVREIEAITQSAVDK